MMESIFIYNNEYIIYCLADKFGQVDNKYCLHITTVTHLVKLHLYKRTCQL